VAAALGVHDTVAASRGRWSLFFGVGVRPKSLGETFFLGLLSLGLLDLSLLLLGAITATAPIIAAIAVAVLAVLAMLSVFTVLSMLVGLSVLTEVLLAARARKFAAVGER
jgi:hypothetical protein